MTAFPARNAPKSLTKLPHCPFSGNDSLGWFYRRLSFLLPERASPSSIVPRVRFVTEISDSTPNAPCVALKLKPRLCATLLRIKSAILPNIILNMYPHIRPIKLTPPLSFASDMRHEGMWKGKYADTLKQPVKSCLCSSLYSIYLLRKHLSISFFYLQ